MPAISKNLTVLYVINILQPATVMQILDESRRLIAPEKLSEDNLSGILALLLKRKLVIKGSDETYSCSPLGLHRIAGLGFWRVRDKSRLLALAQERKND